MEENTSRLVSGLSERIQPILVWRGTSNFPNGKWHSINFAMVVDEDGIVETFPETLNGVSKGLNGAFEEDKLSMLFQSTRTINGRT